MSNSFCILLIKANFLKANCDIFRPFEIDSDMKNISLGKKYVTKYENMSLGNSKYQIQISKNMYMLCTKYPIDENRDERGNSSTFEALYDICGKLKCACKKHKINVKV